MMEIADRLLSIWLAVAVHLWQSTLVLLPLFLLARWLRSAPPDSGSWPRCSSSIPWSGH